MFTMQIHDYRNHQNRKRTLRRQRTVIIGLCAALCIICLILGIFLVKGYFFDDTDARHTDPSASLSSALTDPSSDLSGTTTTTVAPDPTISAEDRALLLTQLEDTIDQYLSSLSGRYAVCYINMENGEIVSVNESIPMVAASSVKIAYNTLLYKKAAEGAFSMDDKMAYNPKPYPTGDFESGTGTIQHSASGTEFTIREISRLSIRISDNCATNMVLRKLGGIDAVNDAFMTPISAVVNYRTAVSYTDYSGAAQSGRHRTSAKDLAKYAEELYRLYSDDPGAYEGLIEDLCNTEFSWGIPAGLPDGTRVAHKIGYNTAYATHNDVGIVFGTEDYVLCVMTETGSETQAKDAIAEVSRMIDEYVQSCHPTT
ncbi:MAG: serine hydrolase [Clostridiales bacterium]|nr:serine hydrolase [Clostridiales bacterium]